jgi:hypothetical protein
VSPEAATFTYLDGGVTVLKISFQTAEIWRKAKHEIPQP